MESYGIWTLAAICGIAVLVAGGCNDAIDPALQKQFTDDLGKTTITVFPAAVRTESIAYNPAAATAIAAALRDAELAEADVATGEPPITGPWYSNQSRMWKESTVALGNYVKEHPIETKYAVMAEYLILGGTREVGGVHIYVVDKSGALITGMLLNSHHKLFSDAKPKNVEDCTNLVISAMKERWHVANKK